MRKRFSQATQPPRASKMPLSALMAGIWRLRFCTQMTASGSPARTATRIPVPALVVRIWRRRFFTQMTASRSPDDGLRMVLLRSIMFRTPVSPLHPVYASFWNGVSSGERLYRHMPDSQKHDSVYVVFSVSLLLFCICHVTCINIYDTGIKQISGLSSFSTS